MSKSYQWGYVKRGDSLRLTPKSSFLRKLERMQQEAAQAAGIAHADKMIDEMFGPPPVLYPRVRLVK